MFCSYAMLLVYQTNRKEMTHYSLNTGSIILDVRGNMRNDQELIRFDQIYICNPRSRHYVYRGHFVHGRRK